jgi:hypothetical protein
MRIVSTTVAAALAALMLAGLSSAVGPSEVSPAGEARKAKLSMIDGSPLTIRGWSFTSRERVKLIVASKKRLTKWLSATGRGTFVVRFPTVDVDRCEGFAAFAIGSRGSRATLGRPHVYCPPPLRRSD